MVTVHISSQYRITTLVFLDVLPRCTGEEFQNQYIQINTLTERYSSTDDSPGEVLILFKWQYLHIASSKHQRDVFYYWLYYR